MNPLHLLALEPEELKAFMLELGEPAFRAAQVTDWLFNHLETDFERMSNLPRGLVEKLQKRAVCTVLKTASEQKSHDGTIKWAFETHDGHFFETVLIPSEGRRSICVSSQIGCAMGCTFCRTATMGFIRNLTLGEILEQVHFVNRHLRDSDGTRLSNVIFMGMGEPLQNLDTVVKSCRRLTSSTGFNLSKHKITVSTSGIVPKIIEWAEKAPEIKLAISLNGSNDTMRSELMPVNRRYPLEKLFAAADEYIRLTGQKLTFEYILIKDKTCTAEAARELRQIASHRNCKINLIPLNKGDNAGLLAPSEEDIEAFQKELDRGGFQVLRRKARGPDIYAACGQLAKEQKKVA